MLSLVYLYKVDLRVNFLQVLGGKISNFFKKFIYIITIGIFAFASIYSILNVFNLDVSIYMKYVFMFSPYHIGEQLATITPEPCLLFDNRAEDVIRDANDAFNIQPARQDGDQILSALNILERQKDIALNDIAFNEERIMHQTNNCLSSIRKLPKYLNETDSNIFIIERDNICDQTSRLDDLVTSNLEETRLHEQYIDAHQIIKESSDNISKIVDKSDYANNPKLQDAVLRFKTHKEELHNAIDQRRISTHRFITVFDRINEIHRQRNENL